MVTTISPSGFLSKCESRLRDKRASKDPEDTSFAHAVSGNSLHNFVLENLFVCNETAGVGRTPWRSMANETVSGSEGLPRLRSGFRLRAQTPARRLNFDSHFPSQAQGRARSGRQRDTVFSQTETLPTQRDSDNLRPHTQKSRLAAGNLHNVVRMSVGLANCQLPIANC